MNSLQSIISAYAVQLALAAMLLTLVPLAKFLTRRMEAAAALSAEQEARLYPLGHGAIFDITAFVFLVALVFDDELRLLSWPLLAYLSVVAPFFFMLALLYRVVRSCALLRTLPANEQASRTFARFTAMTSAAAIVPLVLVMYARMLSK